MHIFHLYAFHTWNAYRIVTLALRSKCRGQEAVYEDHGFKACQEQYSSPTINSKTLIYPSQTTQSIAIYLNSDRFLHVKNRKKNL